MKTTLLHQGPFTLRNIRFEVLRGVSIDSRTIPEDHIFCALKGEHTDGHRFVAAALKNGALAALVNREYAASAAPDEALIICDDTYTGLVEMARIYAKTFTMPVFSLTGSVGKTSTRRMLSHILSATLRIAENPKNFNNHIGLPISILQMRGDEDLAILEMGSSGIGEIRNLCHIIQPQYGLITAIAPAHISGFGSIENIQKAKFELFDAVRDDGILFINADDERVSAYPADTRRRISYGITHPADLRFSVCDIDAAGRYTLSVDGRTFRLQSSGKGAAINACAAYTVAKTLGMDIHMIIRGLISFRPESGRGAIESWNGITLIDDTYNASPLSVKNAISMLSSMQTRGRKIMVFADMLEMGAETRTSHEEIGSIISGSDIDELLCYGSDTRYTVAAAREGKHKNAWHFDNKEKLADHLLSVIKPGDTVLFKGSRGEKVEEIISMIKGK